MALNNGKYYEMVFCRRVDASLGVARKLYRQRFNDRAVFTGLFQANDTLYNPVPFQEETLV